MNRVVLCLIVIFSGPLFAAPASEYWSVWDKSNPDSVAKVDHTLWQEILDAYLVEKPKGNEFDYAGVIKDDRVKLSAYLAKLSETDPRRYGKAEQKAYWINLYNALTVNLILEHYPVSSITKIGPWYSFGPWGQDIISIAGQSLTLNDIEHRILRPLWQDHRIHYAVNCASMGCPDLAVSVFTATNTDDQLERLTQRFIRQEKAVRWNGNQLILSQIYQWYGVDFGDRSAIIRHLQKYSDTVQSQKLMKFSGEIEFRYDWDLNKVSR